MTLICAGDGIDNLLSAQGKYLPSADAMRLVLDGIVLLHPIAHHLRCDAALIRHLA